MIDNNSKRSELPELQTVLVDEESQERKKLPSIIITIIDEKLDIDSLPGSTPLSTDIENRTIQ